MKPDPKAGSGRDGRGTNKQDGGHLSANSTDNGPGAFKHSTGGAAVGSAFLPDPAPKTGDPESRARQQAVRGQELLRRGQFHGSVECYREATRLRPDEAVYHLGLAAAAEGAADDELVERHSQTAVTLAPDNPLGHYFLAKWCYRTGHLGRGVEHAARAAELAPTEVDYVVLHGTLLHAAGRATEARDAIEPLLAAGSDDRWLAHLYARLAPSIKQEGRALEVVETAIRAPGLRNDPGGRPLLHFAASALLDRMGRYGDAFDHARRGNLILRDAAPRHDPAEQTAWVTRKIRYFTRERVDSLPRATHESRRPVFILGMPRSGTSLVEQILGCHPSVHAGGELQALRLVARDSADAEWAAGESYPEYFDDLSVGRANRLAAQYLASIEALDGGAATYVTDKQPLNFLILDMIELLFPRSRVIHCVRGALDTCLSCYMTNFEQHNPFKFDLSDLGAYYRDYLRLMEHWKQVLAVSILEVRYEDLVLDTRGQVRRMVEFLELPWDDRCLRYYESDRPVHTASVDQVRKPIYTASIGRWKHYEKFLGPLIEALGTAG